MKLSKKSRYGLAALIDMSVHSGESHMALCEIADRNDISAQYLEQVFAGLRRAGIVKSIRGAQGGYLLGKEPADITVSEILAALEGDYHMEDEEVSQSSGLGGISLSIQKLLIDRINEELDQILDHLTLEDFQRSYLEDNEDGNMYYI